MLLENGFLQTLSRNKSGYLLTNDIGEKVRIMQRNGLWDIRVQNQFGNYLDEFGKVSNATNAHNIFVFSW